MGSPPNPFTHRGMITDPADFFGREEPLNEILARLRTLQSTSVVGERRIGKSSLLYHLAQTGLERLDDRDDYHFFYFDLEHARFHTAFGFLHTILDEMGIAAPKVKAENTLNQNLIAFTEHIEGLERRGRRIVFCLDEFETTFKHRDQFPEDFFDHLRALVNIRKLVLVTATRYSLQQLSLQGQLTSPFFNVFTVVELKEFSEAEARHFVERHSPKVNFTGAEQQFILSYPHQFHPLKLQIVCDKVLWNRGQNLADWALEDEIEKEFGHFFVSNIKQAHRLKKLLSLDNIKKLFETIKSGWDAFSGPKKS